MPLEIITSDLASITADAIVYAHTDQMLNFFNFNHLQFQEKGKELVKSRAKIRSLSPGEAKITSIDTLDAKYIIHTSAPIWHGGRYNEVGILRSCYEKSFRLAIEAQCKSIALPIIASDGLGYPKKITQEMAFECIRNFTLSHDIKVYLVLPGKIGIILPGNQYSVVDKYIDKNYVEKEDLSTSEGKQQDTSNNSSVHNTQKFTEILLKQIADKGMSQSVICHKANLTARQLTEILNGNSSIIEKTNVIALGLALELTLDEIKDFMKHAGYALTHHSKSDLIIEYCILHNIYDLISVNIILFRFDQKLL